MGVIREDVVQISFDVADNPFDEITKNIDDIKSKISGIDDSIKIPTPEIPTPEMPKMPDLPEPEIPTPEVPKPDVTTFTGMIKQLKETAKIKVGNGLDKLKTIPVEAKAKFDSLKNSISNLKPSTIVKGLDTALGKGVTATGKLLGKLKEVARTNMGKLVSGLGKVASTAGKAALSVGKIALKGAGAAAAGVAGIVGASVKSFADYEQLKGGVETLFGNGGKSFEEYAEGISKSTEAIKEFQQTKGIAVDGIVGPETTNALQQAYQASASAQDMVMQNANNAFKTAGLSANQYMETVTSFSASMLQSVGGDAAEAAKLSDMAIKDMSDNANKMGTDMDSIIQTYQSLSRGNYAMLDNLKLGYGGTKEELQRLIKDASKLDSAVDANSMSYANIAKAIHVVQNDMGITGTTALEAEKTISGSLSTLKAAWGNTLTSLVNGGDEFDRCVENLVESAKTFAGNIMPVIQSSLSGVASLITELAPMIGGALPTLVTTLVPQLITAGMSLMNALIVGVQNNIGNISTAAVQVITGLVSFLLQAAPQVILVGLQLMISLAQGIAQQIPTLLPMAVQAIGQFVMGLVQMLPMVMQTGLMLIMNLVQGIISSLPQIIAYGVQAIVQFITGLVQMLPMVLQSGAQMILALLQAIIANIPALIQGGVQIIIALAGGLLQGIPQIINSAGQLVDSIIETILTTDWIGLALDIVESIGEGIVNGVKSLFGVGEEAGEEVGEGVAAGVANSTSTATYAAQNLSSQTTSSLQLNTPTIESFGVVGVNSLANGITSGGSLAQGAATNISALTSTGFGTSLTDLSAVGMQATTSLAGGITANAGTAVGAASTMKSQVENAAATEVEVKINADTASLESFQSAISSFASQAAAGIQEVPQAFSAAMEEISSVVQSNMDTSSTSLEAGINAMSSASSAFTANLTALFTSGFTAVLTIITATMLAMVAAMSSSCSQMISITSSCVPSIQSIFASTNLYSAGVNMMSGLISGMNAMAGSVMATASNIASQAAAAINGALKIHSPSRVTMESGEYTGEGFAVGLQKMKERVVQASEDLAVNSRVSIQQPKATYTPGTPSVSNVSTNNQNNTYNPQFILNLNGASATDSNKRKIQRWVKESINEAFDSMGRRNPQTVYV